MNRLMEANANVDRIIASLSKAEEHAEKVILEALDLLDELNAIKGEAVAAGGALAQKLPSNIDANVQLISRLVGLNAAAAGTMTALVDENTPTSLFSIKKWVGSVPYNQLTNQSADAPSAAASYRQRMAQRGQIAQPRVDDDMFTPDYESDGPYNENYELGNSLDFGRLSEAGYGDREPIENRIQESFSECLSGDFGGMSDEGFSTGMGGGFSKRDAYDTSWINMPLKGNDKWSTAPDPLKML